MEDERWDIYIFLSSTRSHRIKKSERSVVTKFFSLFPVQKKLFFSLLFIEASHSLRLYGAGHFGGRNSTHKCSDSRWTRCNEWNEKVQLFLNTLKTQLNDFFFAIRRLNEVFSLDSAKDVCRLGGLSNAEREWAIEQRPLNLKTNRIVRIKMILLIANLSSVIRKILQQQSWRWHNIIADNW